MNVPNVSVHVYARFADTYRSIFCVILVVAVMSLLVEPGIAHSQVLGVSGGGTGASTLSGYLYGNGTSPITGSSTIPASASSFTQLGTGALTRDLDAKAKENALSLLDYCSDNTGATDCSAGIAEWLAEGLALNKALYIPAGVYRVSSQLAWYITTASSAGNSEPENVNGINVFGDGRYASWIKFDSGVASPNWQIYGPNSAGSNYLMYSRLENFMVTGNTSGELMTFGREDNSDALNEFQVNNLFLDNANTGASAITLRLNNFLNGLVNVVANGGGFNASTYTGSGYAALYCEQCQMNTFMGSYGNDANGILLAGGYNWGNTFLNTDTEANTSDIFIGDAQSFNNTWIGGIISYASYGINATYGSSNKFINAYDGIPAGNTFMPNSVGVWLESPTISNVSTPSLPASGTAKSNTTGQTVQVTINGGAVSLVQRNGAGLFTQTGVTVILEPGDTITVTYSSAPGWVWMPIRG